MSGGYNPLVLALLRKTKGLGQKAENLSIGLGHGFANQMEGFKQLATNPVAQLDMVNGIGAALSNPRQALESVLMQAKQATTSPLNAGTFAGEMINPRSLAAALGKPMMRDMTAYHGSPHDFDAFDSSKIGTGEGAQAYGHGLYFAEDPKIAKHYKSVLSDDALDRTIKNDPKKVAGELFDEMNDGTHGDKIPWGNNQSLITKEQFTNAFAKEKVDWFVIPEYARAAVTKKYRGKLYNVDIPDEAIGKMLDWDAPVEEMPKPVREAFFAVKPDMRNASLGNMEPEFRNWLRKPETAGVLKDMGYPGIRYLDAGSRQSKKGTRNFVVFDDKILKILSKE
jgi:hypothetical protein